MPHLCIDPKRYTLVHDHYDLGALVEALNSTTEFGECHNITSIEYFIRTTKGNLVVASDEEGMSVFQYDDKSFKNYKEASVNDLILLLGRDTLRYVYNEALPVIGANSCPTPFGVRLHDKDSKGVAIAFQIVVDSDYLTQFHNNFKYKDLKADTELTGISKLIRKQVKYTIH